MAGLFPPLRITYDGQVIDLTNLMTSELKALEKALNVAGGQAVWAQFEAASAAAIEAFTWVALKRRDPSLKLEDFAGRIDLSKWDADLLDKRGHVVQVLPPRAPGEQPRVRACLECIAADKADEQAAAPDPTAAVTETAPNFDTEPSLSPSDSRSTSF